MIYSLPALPYAYHALEPYIDGQTMRIHHTEHHQTYIDKLNAAPEDHRDLQERSSEELLKDLNAIPETTRTAVRNHGGGHANHSFFWPLLRKGVEFGGEVAGAIELDTESNSPYTSPLKKALLIRKSHSEECTC